MNPLTGKELLNKIESLGKTSPHAAARACGYISDSGKVLIAKFYKAILQARGLFEHTPGRRGKAPSFRTHVQPNGSIVINAAYTRILGLKPGTPISITVGKTTITLKVQEDGGLAL